MHLQYSTDTVHQLQKLPVCHKQKTKKGRQQCVVVPTWLRVGCACQTNHDMEEICLVVGQCKAIPQYQLFIGFVTIVAVQWGALQQTEFGSRAYAGVYAIIWYEQYDRVQAKKPML